MEKKKDFFYKEKSHTAPWKRWDLHSALELICKEEKKIPGKHMSKNMI